MRGLTEDDLVRMRSELFAEGPDAGRKLSRYWLLLPLSAVIAAAGVVSDSTATVIGAMIVAPLMTPILGIVLAVVLGDARTCAVRSSSSSPARRSSWSWPACSGSSSPIR